MNLFFVHALFELKILNKKEVQTIQSFVKKEIALCVLIILSK